MSPLRSLFGEDAVILRETNFQLLLLSTIFPVLGSGLLSPVLRSLIAPFGTSAANIGLMIAFFGAPQIVIVPVGGVLADRYSRKQVIISGLVLFGVAGTAIAFTTDFRVVLGLRLLQGIGAAGINPIIITSIGDIYTGAQEATGQGLRFMSSGLSGTVFPMISGLLVVIGWQYPFLLYAMALPVAAAMLLWFEEPINSDAPAAATNRDNRSYRRALFQLAGRRQVVAMVLARALPVVVWIGFLTYNSLIVVRLLDGTPPQAGLLVAVMSGAYAIAASQAGRITTLFDNRLLPLVGANVCLTVGFGIVLFAPGLAGATVGIAIVGVGFGITLSLYRSIITGLAPDDLRAGLVSLAEAVGRIARTLTPVAMGGVIAVATPFVGIASALQLAGLGVAIVGGGGGILCLLIASPSESGLAEQPETIDR